MPKNYTFITQTLNTNIFTHSEQLQSILKAYHERIKQLEDKKYDIEYIVKRKDIEV